MAMLPTACLLGCGAASAAQGRPAACLSAAKAIKEAAMGCPTCTFSTMLLSSYQGIGIRIQ